MIIGAVSITVTWTTTGARWWAVRWDGLFDDLEAQAEALERAELAADVDDRARGEIGGLHWLDRARTAVGSPVRLSLAGGLAVTGVLARVGPEWLLVDEGAGREAVIPVPAILGVRGVGRAVAAPGTDGVVASRLGLRHALRGIARDRAAVRIHLVDARVVDGTVDRVGADFVDVALHAAGEARRRRDVREVELLPLVAIAAVRRSV